MKNCALLSCGDVKYKTFSCNKYGLSLSGGGSVAFSGCIGLFRALNLLDLQHLYNPDAMLSCTSGSSWFCSQYIFANLAPDALLGKYLEPEDCTIENLKIINQTNPFFMGHTVINSNIGKTLEELYLDHTIIDSQLWIKSIAQTFLQPYNLDNVLIEDDTLLIRGKIEPLYKIINSTQNRPRFPSLIINTTLIQKEYTHNGIINIYMTTNQSGFQQSVKSDDYPTLGKVLIQSFSYGCKAVDKCCGNEYRQVEMPVEQPYLSLEFMTGISSYVPELVKFIQQTSKVIPSDIDLNPKLNLWSPKNSQNVVCDVGDGGLNRTSGVLGLLSKSVKRIFLFYTRTDGNQTSPFIIPTLQKLFGVASDENSVQVFSSTDYPNIESQLKTSYESGDPTFAYVKNLRVIPNRLHGITGNYNINFLVFVTNPCAKYTMLLPKETQEAIKTRAFPFFPNYPLIFANGLNILELNLQQINLLSNYVQWCILNDPIKSILINLYR